ncbi:HAD-IIB family hydrolase [Enterococcus massiliensis]|uniref:HAD-IIB family hydrolase n=1 Tax=Enterococcus massiliensis TaxID=1640685 RepID=UPI00065E44D2|nr:HAD-IIB family hydrolase [Enterococcus massiliensis]
MKNQLLICDLDGTLLDANGKVDHDSLEKIKKFCEDGGHFVICTGRMDSDIQYVEQQLGFKGEFRISQNGAVIKNAKEETVFFESIPSEYIASLNQAIFGMNLRTEVSTLENRLFPSPRDPENVAEFIDTSIVIKNLPDYVLQHAGKATIYLTFGTTNEFTTIKERIEKNLGKDKVGIVQTSPSSLEVFSAKVSKGNAVSFIMGKLAVSRKNVYVAGDAESDVSMFHLTDHAYAVREAHSDIIEQAGHYQKTVGHIVDEIYVNVKGV